MNILAAHPHHTIGGGPGPIASEPGPLDNEPDNLESITFEEAEAIFDDDTCCDDEEFENDVRTALGGAVETTPSGPASTGPGPLHAGPEMAENEGITEVLVKPEEPVEPSEAVSTPTFFSELVADAVEKQTKVENIDGPGPLSIGPGPASTGPGPELCELAGLDFEADNPPPAKRRRIDSYDPDVDYDAEMAFIELSNSVLAAQLASLRKVNSALSLELESAANAAFSSLEPDSNSSSDSLSLMGTTETAPLPADQVETPVEPVPPFLPAAETFENMSELGGWVSLSSTSSDDVVPGAVDTAPGPPCNETEQINNDQVDDLNFLWGLNFAPESSSSAADLFTEDDREDGMLFSGLLDGTVPDSSQDRQGSGSNTANTGINAAASNERDASGPAGGGIANATDSTTHSNANSNSSQQTLRNGKETSGQKVTTTAAPAKKRPPPPRPSPPPAEMMPQRPLPLTRTWEPQFWNQVTPAPQRAWSPRNYWQDQQNMMMGYGNGGMM